MMKKYINMMLCIFSFGLITAVPTADQQTHKKFFDQAWDHIVQNSKAYSIGCGITAFVAFSYYAYVVEMKKKKLEEQLQEEYERECERLRARQREEQLRRDREERETFQRFERARRAFEEQKARENRERVQREAAERLESLARMFRQAEELRRQAEAVAQERRREERRRCDAEAQRARAQAEARARRQREEDDRRGFPEARRRNASASTANALEEPNPYRILGKNQPMLVFNFMGGTSRPTDDHWFYILDVPNMAPYALVKKSFNKLSLMWHPDRHPENKAKAEAEAAFKLINRAHQECKRILGVA